MFRLVVGHGITFKAGESCLKVPPWCFAVQLTLTQLENLEAQKLQCHSLYGHENPRSVGSQFELL